MVLDSENMVWKTKKCMLCDFLNYTHKVIFPHKILIEFLKEWMQIKWNVTVLILTVSKKSALFPLVVLHNVWNLSSKI